MTEAEIQNFDAFDAFDDADEKQGDQSKVHIRVQQRNGRKCITTVQGLADDLDVKRICKAFKKGPVQRRRDKGLRDGNHPAVGRPADERERALVDQEMRLKSQSIAWV